MKTIVERWKEMTYATRVLAIAGVILGCPLLVLSGIAWAIFSMWEAACELLDL